MLRRSEKDMDGRPGPPSTPLWHGLKLVSRTSPRIASTLQHLNAAATVVGLIRFSGLVLQIGLSEIQMWQVNLMKSSTACLSIDPGSHSLYTSFPTRGSSHFGIRIVGSPCRLAVICFQVGASPRGYLISSTSSSSS